MEQTRASRGGSGWCRERRPLVEGPVWAVGVVVLHELVEDVLQVTLVVDQ